jgi:Glycosyltransferase 61
MKSHRSSRHGKVALFLISSTCLILYGMVGHNAQQKLDHATVPVFDHLNTFNGTVHEDYSSSTTGSSDAGQHSSRKSQWNWTTKETRLNSSSATTSLNYDKVSSSSTDTSSSSSSPAAAACKASKSTLPAQFTNYSDQSIQTSFHRLFDLDQVPVMRRHTSSSSSSLRPYATCSILHVGNWIHFAHTFQQVLRCWSFWQTFPNHQPVLVGTPLGDTFNQGIVTTLIQLGVQFRDWNNVTRKSSDDNGTGIHNHDNNNKKEEDKSLSVTSKLEPVRAASGVDVLDGYKVLSSLHAEQFRDQFLTILGIEKNEGSQLEGGRGRGRGRGGCNRERLGRPSPRIGILNRKASRRLVNQEEITRALAVQNNHGDNDNNNSNTSGLLDHPNVIVFEMEGKSFQEQVQLLSQVDILVAPHGAALTGTIFMPRCAGLVEIFPMGMAEEKFFGSLASLSHHAHAALYAGGENWTKQISYWSANSHRRTTARKRNVCPQVDLVLDAVAKLEWQWHNCCSDGGEPEEREK